MIPNQTTWKRTGSPWAIASPQSLLHTELNRSTMAMSFGRRNVMSRLPPSAFVAAMTVAATASRVKATNITVNVIPEKRLPTARSASRVSRPPRAIRNVPCVRRCAICSAPANDLPPSGAGLSFNGNLS